MNINVEKNGEDLKIIVEGRIDANYVRDKHLKRGRHS